MGDYSEYQFEEKAYAYELAKKHGLFRETERLKEQLKEANAVIKYYGMGVVTVTGYWGDKPYARPEETTSFPEKALEYLKKWGVK